MFFKFFQIKFSLQIMFRREKKLYFISAKERKRQKKTFQRIFRVQFEKSRAHAIAAEREHFSK